jgi:predicted Zn finger-like uncharacterized protein
MSLITRCPSCGTAFRVQPSQLAAHSGTVRCGKCGELFNGVAALIDETEERLALEPSPQLGLFDAAGRQPEPTLVNVAHDPPAKLMHEERPARPRAWTLLVFLATAALAGQITYRYRAEISALLPAARSTIEALCKPLDCDVPLPRRPELMSIDSSELQTDARREGLIALNAVIRNRARFAQDYPSLELTLTDEGDRPVLRRVLAPRDYLEAARRNELMAKGIAPGSEAQLRVLLDSSRARASGYRLYLFFPS